MSADLFAAFEDASHPPPPQQQSRSKPASTQSRSAPFAFESISNPPVATPTSSQQWGQFSSTSNSSQLRHSWQPQSSPAPGTRPTFVATGAFASIQPLGNDDTEDDDGWGDFEVAPDTAPSPTPLQAAPVAPNLGDG
ncbi:hypothetical protein CIB48_g10546 [Xylaria polymorpha]|nr:hypothetical protein CIB48_g10546 [Xylaria polymorpha]